MLGSNKEGKAARGILRLWVFRIFISIMGMEYTFGQQQTDSINNDKLCIIVLSCSHPIYNKLIINDLCDDGKKC